VATIDERKEGRRLLEALELGRGSLADAPFVAESLDPALFYAIVAFLRANYPASDPAATPVLERVVRLTTGHPTLVARHREGESDSISRWLESEHDYREFRGRGEALIDLVMDKIES